MTPWPTSGAELERLQARLGEERPAVWTPPADALRVAGCFVCFPRGLREQGAAGDRAWAAGVLIELGEGRGLRVVEERVVRGEADAAYSAGRLALREGALLERVLRLLTESADVLMVNASGRDHPRRAGLALQLGAVLDRPSVGVTHRSLVASGDWPADEPGATSPLSIGDEVVGAWLRTRRGRRPLAVHAGWRTTPETAVAIVQRSVRSARTPEALRLARRSAREARASDERG